MAVSSLSLRRYLQEDAVKNHMTPTSPVTCFRAPFSQMLSPGFFNSQDHAYIYTRHTIYCNKISRNLHTHTRRSQEFQLRYINIIYDRASARSLCMIYTFYYARLLALLLLPLGITKRVCAVVKFRPAPLCRGRGSQGPTHVAHKIVNEMHLECRQRVFIYI